MFWRPKEFNVVHIVKLCQLTLSWRTESGTVIYKPRCATNSIYRLAVKLVKLLASNAGIMIAPKKQSTWMEVDISIHHDGFSQLTLHF